MTHKPAPPNASPKSTQSQSPDGIQRPTHVSPSNDAQSSNKGDKPESSNPPSQLSRAGPLIITVEALKADLFDASDEEGLGGAPVEGSVDAPEPPKTRPDSPEAAAGIGGCQAKEEEEEEEVNESPGSADPRSALQNGYEPIRGSRSSADDDEGAAISDESSFLRLEAAAIAEEEDEAAKLERNGDNQEEELNLDKLLKGIGNLSGDYASDEDNS
jgi:hypothetical protein